MISPRSKSLVSSAAHGRAGLSLSDRFKRPQALIVLPYDELPMSKWNGNPYALDGGREGRSEDDGAYFLLPYWMGRFHKVLPE